MAFHPDILVTTAELPRIALVVEAKVRIPDLDRTEQELKRYMVGMQCPVGLLVTPDRLWLYRDLYTGRSENSVQRVGEYDATALWGQTPPREPLQFEIFVQQWLERLTEQVARDLPYDLAEAVRDCVLPAVLSGEVRAAGPRWQ